MEGMLERHYDQLTGADTISKKLQRNVIMSTMNEAIAAITTDTVRKIARRCGAMFELNPSLEMQFSKVKLRGYTVMASEEVRVDGDFNYRNVFEGVGVEASKRMRKDWSLK